MSNLLNLTIFEGHLGHDAEVKTTTGGQTVVRYRIANTRHWKSRNGTPGSDTTWMNVVDWRPNAVNLAQYLKRGTALKVIGSLRSRSYQDNAGQKRTIVELVADDVMLGRSPLATEQAHTLADTTETVYDPALQQEETEVVKPW